jgi:limonene 1,2-monooxygenase
MHIADTVDQAAKDVEFGLADWISYFQNVAALALAPNTADPASMVASMNESGIAVIGTPDQAAAQIQRLIDQSGGYGTYLFMAHEWADREATLRSFELFAREVMPQFQGSSASLVASRDWAAQNRPQFIGAAAGAVMQAIGDHHAEKAARAGRPAS